MEKRRMDRWGSLGLGLALLAGLGMAPAAAITPYLVRDIDPLRQEDGSGVLILASFDNGTALFSAFDDEGLGVELWASDGSAGGTQRLADACPGSCSSSPFVLAANGSWALVGLAASGAPGALPDLWLTRGTAASTVRVAQAVGLERNLSGLVEWSADRGRVFFRATTPGFGAELWTSDGTAAGTRRVADLEPGVRGSDPLSLKFWNGRLYFSATDTGRGRALWKSDGTAAGTVLVKDPIPGPASSLGPLALTVAGRRLYFVAAPPGRLGELWASDGTTAGTVVLTKISQLHMRSGAGAPQAVGDRLFFLGLSPRDGGELWASDGTVATTRKLTAFPRATAFEDARGSLGLRATPLGNRLVFLANDGTAGEELWVSDGSAAGTRLLRDFCPGACSGQPAVVATAGGRLFLKANDGTSGQELWTSDGTPAGTRLAKDLCPGACSGGARFVATYGARVYFTASDGSRGFELWASDGTPAGTRNVADLCPGACGSDPYGVFEFLPGGFLVAAREAEGEDRALFYIDGQRAQASRVASFGGGLLSPVGTPPVRSRILFANADPQLGLELWRTDGTAAGTFLVRNLSTTDRGGSHPASFLALGSSALFLADDGVRGRELWKSDGTGAGTELVHEFEPGPGGTFDDVAGASVELAGKRFFFFGGPFGKALWVSDGTSAGTLRLTPDGVLAPARNGEMVAVGGTVFFAAGTAQNYRLWASDGTAAGTRQVSAVASSPFALTAFRGQLYFAAGGGPGGKLWVSDGTAAGTLPVEDADLDPIVAPSGLLEHAGRLYFLARRQGGFEPTLFASDGTPEGAEPIAEVEGAERLYAAGGRLFAAGEDGLFSSDGTAAGTRFVGFYRVHLADSVVAFRDQLFFVLPPFDGLWKSDGTAAGTVQVQDADGHRLVVFGGLFELGGRLLFGGALDSTGVPVLWQTDGTGAGTTPALAVDGQPLATRASEAARTSGRLFLPAFDRHTGFELWAVRPD